MLNDRSTVLIVVLACFLLTSCVSGRTEHKMMRRDGTPVTCFEPPPDVVTKRVNANADAAYNEIGRILKGSVELATETQRIRELSKSVNDYEAIDFRVCMNYANEVLTREQYSLYLTDIKKLLQETSNAAPRQSLSPSSVKQPSVPTSSHESDRPSSPASGAERSVSSCSNSDPSISCLWK